MTSTILVSTDNGNSTTIVDTEAAASDFLRRYGAQNVVAAIRDAGLDPESVDTELEVLGLLAKAHRDGEIPTLP